jgi:hypothetical protein
VVERRRRGQLNDMGRLASAIRRCAACVALVSAGASCSTTTPACPIDGSGSYVCAGYAGAYPYDYAYVDPLYAGAGGYYPYTIDTYYDPLGGASVHGLRAAPVPIADPVTGSGVPELLGQTQRAAEAVNAGVRAALDPIKALLETPPAQSGDHVVYGPARVGAGDYQFTLRTLSASANRFGWKLEARPSGSIAGFTRVAGGVIRVGDVPRRGHGGLGVDCDALAAADSSVTCRGTLLIGFAHTDAGDKILNVGLRAYTPDPAAILPLDAAMFAWRQDDSANHVRLVARTNLAGTATPAAETVALKLTWLRDVGVRVDAAATGGDVPAGQVTTSSSCVAADLITPSCGAGLQTPATPNPDPTASDPPAGMPETPDLPAAMPDGDSR